jgi:hypothetical protein
MAQKLSEIVVLTVVVVAMGGFHFQAESRHVEMA